MIESLATAVMAWMVLLALSVWLLPFALAVAVAWTRLVSEVLPEHARRRLDELKADLHDHRMAALDEGYSPAQIGWQIVSRLIRGIPADVARTTEEWLADRRAAAAIEELARRADVVDPYTWGHSQRVARLAAALARQLGQSRSATRRIRLAALAHDVGKLEIPSRIILKPGPLTPAEVSTMQGHSDLGATMVRNFGTHDDVADMILHHHEHYDGSGFPAGQDGERIPLGSRILFVADAFDAMTTDRPYRRGRADVEALRLVQERGGRLFDPNVVAVLSTIVTRTLPRRKRSRLGLFRPNAGSAR